MIVASANDATKTIVATIVAAVLAAPSLVTLVLVVRSIARLREAFPVALLERARFRDIAAPAFFAPAPRIYARGARLALFALVRAQRVERRLDRRVVTGGQTLSTDTTDARSIGSPVRLHRERRTDVPRLGVTRPRIQRVGGHAVQERVPLRRGTGLPRDARRGRVVRVPRRHA